MGLDGWTKAVQYVAKSPRSIRVSLCQRCGAAFYATSPAWGDRTCGDCLANQIEWSLIHQTPGEQRKPMRRSGGTALSDDELLAGNSVERRSA
jgi:hypothetical protein